MQLHQAIIDQISMVREAIFCNRRPTVASTQVTTTKLACSQNLKFNRFLTIVPEHLPIDARLYINSDHDKNHHQCNQNRTNYYDYWTPSIRVNKIRGNSIWRKQGGVICQRARCQKRGVEVRWNCRGHDCRMQRRVVMSITVVYSFQR